MDKYGYESFVRCAFSVNKNRVVERSGDPAMLGDASWFNIEDIAYIKSAVSYSMSIYRNEISARQLGATDNELEDMGEIIKNVHKLEELPSLLTLIEKFDRKYVDKYIKFKWNQGN